MWDRRWWEDREHSREEEKRASRSTGWWQLRGWEKEEKEGKEDRDGEVSAYGALLRLRNEGQAKIASEECVV